MDSPWGRADVERVRTDGIWSGGGRGRGRLGLRLDRFDGLCSGATARPGEGAREPVEEDGEEDDAQAALEADADVETADPLDDDGAEVGLDVLPAGEYLAVASSTIDETDLGHRDRISALQAFAVPFRLATDDGRATVTLHVAPAVPPPAAR